MTRWTICTVLVKQGRHRSSATFFCQTVKRNRQNDKEVILQVKRDALIGEAEARKESTIGDLFVIVCFAPICISYIMDKLIALLSLFVSKIGESFHFSLFPAEAKAAEQEMEAKFANDTMVSFSFMIAFRKDFPFVFESH